MIMTKTGYPGNAPCKGCAKRYVNCHDKCVAYKTWALALSNYNSEVRNERWLNELARKTG